MGEMKPNRNWCWNGTKNTNNFQIQKWWQRVHSTKKIQQSNCSFGYKVLAPPPKHVKTEYGKFQSLVNHTTNVHICKAYWLFMLYPMLDNIMIMTPPVALEIGHNIGLHAIKRIIMTFDTVASFVLNETGMIFTCSFIFVKFTWRKQTNQ